MFSQKSLRESIDPLQFLLNSDRVCLICRLEIPIIFFEVECRLCKAKIPLEDKEYGKIFYSRADADSSAMYGLAACYEYGYGGVIYIYITFVFCFYKYSLFYQFRLNNLMTLPLNFMKMPPMHVFHIHLLCFILENVMLLVKE